MTGTVRVDSGVLSSPSTQFYVSGDLLSQSIDDNTSTIRCYMRAVNRGNASSFYGGAGTQQGRIDYTTESGAVSEVFRTRTQSPFLPSGYGTGAQRWEDGPYDVVIPHEPDGTRSIRFRMILDYGSIDKDLRSSLVTLPTIPRATVPTLTNSSRQIGQTTTINLPRASESFTHNITYQFGSLTGQTAGLSAHTGVGTSATFTVPTALVTEMVAQSSRTLTFTVVTMSGVTVVGSKTVQLTVTPANGTMYQRPTVNATVVRALSDGTPDDDGECAKVSITAAVSSVLVSTEQNELNWKTEVSSDAGVSWDELGSGTVASHGLTLNSATTYTDSDPGSGGTQPFSTTAGYLIRITITDAFSSTATQVVQMLTAAAILDIYDGGGDPDASGVSIGALFNPSLGSRFQVGGANALFAIGEYRHGLWTSDTVPAGTLPADGSVHNIADWPKLAAHFVTVFGTANHFGGDGITTFGMPDSRERVAVNQGGGDIFSVLGSTTGTKTHVHELSDSGFAKITIRDGNTRIARITVPSYERNILGTATPSAATGSETQATALGGATDAGSSVQPSFVVRVAIQAV